MKAAPTLRKALLLGATPLAVVVIAVSSLVLADQLPVDAIPSHWGRSGRSDGTMPLGSFTAFMFALAGLSGLGALALRHRVVDALSQRLTAGLAVGAPLAAAVIHLGTLLAARGTTGPIPFPSTAFTVALVVLLSGTAAAAALARPIERHRDRIDAEPIEVEPGEAVVWTGTTTAPLWLWGILLSATVVALWAFTVAALPWLGVALAVVLLGSASVLHIRMSVGPAGVTVRLGPLGLVRLRVPLEEITGWHAEQVDPLSYGGWGLRVLPGVRALVLRRGPGLRLERHGRPALVVTNDEAAVAAGVLAAHLGARDRTAPRDG